ncbi:hypothetical protein PHLGIDRAFT_179970 [Phlebiopsis gigantea 11061_1 CR5-6]|uniref:F-box domain-containing protein n=1 Tax=Phlebiopsis gigantea (strain 11061_1 CR5-6) TaxID=745531 RepID=A0A0C3PGH3_PHLG1|nr:hypothetical protein PHLGIDRAFT_179970 [Phlebiopsis gigantea 11061_1 CR5-6]
MPLSPESTQKVWLIDDIVPEVLLFLHKEKTTLSACTLVCRSWVHPASQHLFRRICFRPGRPPETTNAISSTTTFEELLEFLETCGRARSALRKLSLCSRAHAAGDILGKDNEHLLDVFALFADVQRLVHKRMLPIPVTSSNSTLWRDPEIDRRLADMPKLSIASLSLDTYTGQDPPRGSSTLPFIFLDVFRSVADPAVLRKIEHVSLFKQMDLILLDMFMRDIVSSVEEVNLRISSTSVDTGFLRPFHGHHTSLPVLKTCPKLAKVSLYVDLWPWQGSDGSHVGNLRTFVAALSVAESACAAPALRELELVLLLRHNALSVPLATMTPRNVVARVRELPWERLGELLPARTRTLERVCVRLDKNVPPYRAPWLGDQVKEVLNGRLPSRVAELICYH